MCTDSYSAALRTSMENSSRAAGWGGPGLGEGPGHPGARAVRGLEGSSAASGGQRCFGGSGDGCGGPLVGDGQAGLGGVGPVVVDHDQLAVAVGVGGEQ